MSIGKGIYLRNGIYWLKFQSNGERKYFSLETRDPAVAVRRAMELRNAPSLQPKSEMAADVTRYIAHKRRLNIYTERTAKLNKDVLEEFTEKFAPLAPREIRSAHIEKHYAALQARVAETTAQIHIRAIRAFFAWCEKERIVQVNPAASLKVAKVERPARVRFCTKAQRDKLIDEAPTDDLRYILFAGFHAGLRKNEIIEARVRWFNLHEGGSLHVCSTPTYRLHAEEEHHVPISGAFREFLVGYLAGKDPEDFALQPKVKHGKARYRYDFDFPFTAYTTSQNLRWVSAHVMRHTFASLLVQSGVSIFKVARWLGDGVGVVEKHYAHLAPQDADIEKMM